MSGFKFAKQKPVFIHGKFLEIEVFRLPTELLVFNIGNGRFAAELIGEEKRLNRKLDVSLIFCTLRNAVASTEVWEACNNLIDESYSQQKGSAKKPVHIFAGVVHCQCGQRMYVPSNSPKYVCRGCRNKISIADLDGIFCEEIKGYSLSPEAIANCLKSSDDTANEKERLIVVQREELQRVRKEIQRTARRMPKTA